MSTGKYFGANELVFDFKKTPRGFDTYIYLPDTYTSPFADYLREFAKEREVEPLLLDLEISLEEDGVHVDGFYVLPMAGEEDTREELLTFASPMEKEALRGLGEKAFCYIFHQLNLPLDTKVSLEASGYVPTEITNRFAKLSLAELERYTEAHYPGHFDFKRDSEEWIREFLPLYENNEQLVKYYQRYGFRRESPEPSAAIPMQGLVKDIFFHCDRVDNLILTTQPEEVERRIASLPVGSVRIVDLNQPTWEEKLVRAKRVLIEITPQMKTILRKLVGIYPADTEWWQFK